MIFGKSYLQYLISESMEFKLLQGWASYTLGNDEEWSHALTKKFYNLMSHLTKGCLCYHFMCDLLQFIVTCGLLHLLSPLGG